MLKRYGMPNNKSLVNKKPFSEYLYKLNTWPLEYSRAVILFDKVYISKYIALSFQRNVRTTGVPLRPVGYKSVQWTTVTLKDKR
jgi:hypothetical protein